MNCCKLFVNNNMKFYLVKIIKPNDNAVMMTNIAT